MTDTLPDTLPDSELIDVDALMLETPESIKDMIASIGLSRTVLMLYPNEYKPQATITTTIGSLPIATANAFVSRLGDSPDLINREWIETKQDFYVDTSADGNEVALFSDMTIAYNLSDNCEKSATLSIPTVALALKQILSGARVIADNHPDACAPMVIDAINAALVALSAPTR